MPTLEELVHQWHAQQPHPKAPSIKVGDYPVAARMATILKFGQGHASPQEVANFWHEFQGMNQALQVQGKMPVSPDEFTHLAQQMARSSFAYHGRPPSMHEIQRLRDADPKAIHDYYGALPDEHYPTISASDMAKYLALSQPHSQQWLDRGPNKLEAHMFAHGGFSAQAISEYYRTMSGDHQVPEQGGGGGVSGGDDRWGGQRDLPASGSQGSAQGIPPLGSVGEN